MIATALALAALLLALVPALLFRRNLALYAPPPPAPASAAPGPSVSLLIPARDEARTIGPALEAALASRGVLLEALVLDDRSRDGTAALVRGIAARDPRVRLIEGSEPPPGWCGKMHACAALARAARHDILVFIDADVRLEPDGLARAAAFLERSGADLASGIPRQEAVSPLERAVIPLIHLVLLGFLPLGRMRASRHPAYAAGCGQLFVARRAAYERAGGHAAVRATLHDGLALPRAFRRAGLATDLFDATALARCRMFEGAAALWRGLGRNATEGLAAPRVIGPATLLLLGGQALPFALLAAAPALPPAATALAGAAALLALYPRVSGLRRFRQPLAGALLHPLGAAALVAIQWQALGRALLGRPSMWRGRAYAPTGPASAPPRPRRGTAPATGSRPCARAPSRRGRGRRRRGSRRRRAGRSPRARRRGRGAGARTPRSPRRPSHPRA